jgi:hypothetical protein
MRERNEVDIVTKPATQFYTSALQLNLPENTGQLPCRRQVAAMFTGRSARSPVSGEFDGKLQQAAGPVANTPETAGSSRQSGIVVLSEIAFTE